MKKVNANPNPTSKNKSTEVIIQINQPIFNLSKSNQEQLKLIETSLKNLLKDFKIDFKFNRNKALKTLTISKKFQLNKNFNCSVEKAAGQVWEIIYWQNNFVDTKLIKDEDKIFEFFWIDKIGAECKRTCGMWEIVEF